VKNAILLAMSRFAPVALVIAAFALILTVGCSNGNAGASASVATPAAAPTQALSPAATATLVSIPATQTATEVAAPPTPPPPTATPVPVIIAPPATTTPRAPTPVPMAVPLPTPPAPIPEGPLELTLNLKDMSFDPHQIHGNAGQQVILTLVADSQDHTFTVPSLSIDLKLPAKSRTTAQFVVPVDGIEPFYCRNHGAPASGMHGLLVFH
jgi:plastocyanin